jgi:hypothetical protein
VILNQSEATLGFSVPAPRRFAPQIARHLRSQAVPYPLIIHLHAAAFVGWLMLLTAQVLLVRAKRLDLHRRLGLLGAGLAAFMFIIGPATAVFVHRRAFGTANEDPSFLAIQLTDILAFAGLIIPALLWRRDSAVHKRLVLLATLYITDAGFTRWLGDPIANMLAAHPFASQMAALYLCPDILVAGLGAYDLITRRRLHPAYIAGATWIITAQLTGTSLLLSAAWKPISVSLIGH